MLRGSLLILIVLLAIVAIANSGVFDSDEQMPGKVVLDSSTPTANDSEESEDEAAIAPRRALGQMIVARFSGQAPPPAFLARIKRGEIGGVILFRENLHGGEVAIANRIERLQRAARKGGNPPLLIMVDQEGGTVKRLAGPPRSAASAMGEGEAREQGEATGNLLRRLGFNVDLAPVADVGHSGSFIGSRAFSSSAEEVAGRACEFADGLRSEGVAATLKHFPGLGLASANTDETVVTVDATPQEVRADYAPYRSCGAEPLTLIMVGSAIYPSLTGNQPAVMSPLTYKRELPRADATGLTISDDLETPAIANQTTPARRSINAGLDLLLYAATEPTSAYSYTRLLEDIRSGAVDRERVEESATEILALKEQLGG